MAKPPDMRQWVTTEDLNVSPEVLGLALATPTRRLMAMLLDLAVIGIVSSFANFWWLCGLALVGVVHARGQGASKVGFGAGDGAVVRPASASAAAAPPAPSPATAAPLALASRWASRLGDSALMRHPRHWPLSQWLLLGLAAVLVVAGGLQSWEEHTKPRPAKHQRSNANDDASADALAEAAERIADAAEEAAEKAAEKTAERASTGSTEGAARPIVRRAGGMITLNIDRAEKSAATASAASGVVSDASASAPGNAFASAPMGTASDPSAAPSASNPGAAGPAASQVINAATALALAQQSERIRKLEAKLAEARRARSLDPRVWLRRWADDLGVGYGFALIYFSLLPAWWGGQTVGKRLLRLRVVELTGKPMSALRNLKRFGGYAAGMATGGLGLVQLMWDSNRQAIQDKTAHTAVIDLRRPRLAPQPPSLPPAPAGR